MRKKIIATSVLVLLALLAACAFPGARPGPVTISPEQQKSTSQAKTLSALATSIAEGNNPSVGVPSSSGATPSPTITTISIIPGAPTATLTPTPAPIANSTPNDPNIPCNLASFVRDVTFMDGSILPPNSPFTKTWEIKNTGSCAWNAGYSIVFAGQGISMDGPATTPVVSQGEIKPGESGFISVSLRAPGELGDYKGYWMLRSGDGKTFGTGPNGGAPFYVEIRVAEEFSFAQHVCNAKWSTGAGDLTCPGKESDSQGFVLPVSDPTMENNEEREGVGMLVAPQPSQGGMIVGRFPPVTVPAESDFRATISCQQGMDGCYLRFKVTYQIDNGPEQLLGEWNEGYEGGVTEAVKDLDMVAGRATAFNFYVTVAGTPSQSRGIWFNPRITK